MRRPVDRYPAESALRALDQREPPFCRPLEAGQQSSARAVGARLGRLLTSLETEINGYVCEGLILETTLAYRRDLLARLRAEGWRVSYDDIRHRWKVLPPR